MEDTVSLRKECSCWPGCHAGASGLRVLGMMDVLVVVVVVVVVVVWRVE